MIADASSALLSSAAGTNTSDQDVRIERRKGKSQGNFPLTEILKGDFLSRLTLIICILFYTWFLLF